MIGRMHLTEPRAVTRTALLTMQIATRADARAALDLIEHSEDGVLIERLLKQAADVLGRDVAMGMTSYIRF